MSLLFQVRDILNEILLKCSPLELYNLRRTCKYLSKYIRDKFYSWEDGSRSINGHRWGFYSNSKGDTWITDIFTIHYYGYQHHSNHERYVEYIQDSLKITYKEISFGFKVETWVGKIRTYVDLIDRGVRDIIYLINNKEYSSDRYLYIYDKLVIIGINQDQVSVYSAKNGLLFTVMPSLELVEFFYLKPKKSNSEKSLKSKILDSIYETDNGIAIGGLESLLNKKPFFDNL